MSSSMSTTATFVLFAFCSPPSVSFLCLSSSLFVSVFHSSTLLMYFICPLEPASVKITQSWVRWGLGAHNPVVIYDCTNQIEASLSVSKLILRSSKSWSLKLFLLSTGPSSALGLSMAVHFWSCLQAPPSMNNLWQYIIMYLMSDISSYLWFICHVCYAQCVNRLYRLFFTIILQWNQDRERRN